MAIIKSLRVGFGFSVATNPNNWLKASSEMEIDLNPEDMKNLDKIYEDAYARCTDEVYKQLKKFEEK